MNKYNFQSFCFCLLLILCACTSNDELNNPGDNQDSSQNSVFINLSVTNQSRASGKYEYDIDAYTPYENAIVNGKVFIYDGKNKSEDQAVCVAYGNLTPKDVTSLQGQEFSIKPVDFHNIELSQFDYDENGEYYALVILNSFGLTEPSVSQTFSDWAKTPQENTMLDNPGNAPNNSYKNITMTNATGHINIKNGETFNPKTLVRINPADLKKGKFPDNHKSSTTVYVQRNVAKVVVKMKDGITGEDKLFTVGDFTLQLNFLTFKLNAINTSSYPVMNIDGLTWDKSYSHSGSSSFDRIYWAKDPNYNDPTTLLTASSVYPVQAGNGFPLYCLENTFNYNRMLQGQTTRIIFRCGVVAEVKDNNNVTWDRIILPSGYNPKDIETEFFKTGKGEKENLWDKPHIEQALKAKATSIFGGEENDYSISWKVVSNQGNNGGFYSLQQLLTISQNGTDISSRLDELAPALNIENASNVEISFFDSGYCYFVARIRHYLDDEAQSEDESVAWNESMITTNSDGKKVADYKPRHLGRYGVLRNNYYHYTVNSIRNLGSPQPIPDFNPDDTDDMPNDYYIDLSLEVRKWGLRTQSFDF